MNGNGEQQMIVARPPVFYRIVACAFLAFILPMLYLCVWRPEEMEISSAGERVSWVGFFALLAAGAVYMLAYVHGSYYWWDDKRIGHRFLWHKLSMRWEEIVSCYTSRLDMCAYVLRDTTGARLTVDFKLLAGESSLSLYRTLSERLAHVEDDLRQNEKEVAQIEASAESCFRIGWRGRSLSVRGDSLTYKGPFKRRRVSLPDIRYIYIAVG